MSLLDNLVQAFDSIGTGTPESADRIFQEQQANQWANQNNSVMGSERQDQLLGEQSPFMATVSQLVNSLNPIDWMGGMQGAEQALPALGGRFFHGTPNVFKEFDPAVSKASGLAGPGIAYLTDAPSVAHSYAVGATNPGMSVSEMAPNIRPYSVKNFNSLDLSKPMPPADLNALTKSLLTDLGQSSGGFQKGNQANRAQNIVNAIKPQVGSSQEIFNTLQSMLGPERANQVIKNAGFQAIEYPGGSITGGTPHRAINVLDSSIMRNLFEFLSGKGGVAK